MLSFFIFAFLSSRAIASTYYVSSNSILTDYTCSDGPNSICDIHCDVYSGLSQQAAVTYNCGNAGECNFHCESTLCASNANIIATNSNNLYVTVGADGCMQNATVNSPNDGNATFDVGASYQGFSGMQVYAGQNTQNIIIDVDVDSIAACYGMQVHASTAEYVQISLGTGNKWESGFLQCPVDSSHTHTASCMIYADGAILQNTEFIANDGMPRNIWIHPDALYWGTNSITCIVNGESIINITPFNQWSECWFTHNPTTTPTHYPTYVPTLRTSQPTATPTSPPTSVPTSPPTSVPTSPPTKTPSMYPSKFPTNPPSVNPSITPTISPSTIPSIPPSKNTPIYIFDPTNPHNTNETVIVPSNTDTDSGSASSRPQLDLGLLFKHLDITWSIIAILILLVCCCGCCLFYHMRHAYKQQTKVPVKVKPPKPLPLRLPPAQKYTIPQKVKINVSSKSSPSSMLSKSGNYSNDGFDTYPIAVGLISSPTHLASYPRSYNSSHPSDVDDVPPILSQNSNSVGSYVHGHAGNNNMDRSVNHHWQLQKLRTMSQRHLQHANYNPHYVSHFNQLPESNALPQVPHLLSRPHSHAHIPPPPPAIVSPSNSAPNPSPYVYVYDNNNNNLLAVLPPPPAPPSVISTVGSLPCNLEMKLNANDEGGGGHSAKTATSSLSSISSFHTNVTNPDGTVLSLAEQKAEELAVQRTKGRNKSTSRGLMVFKPHVSVHSSFDKEEKPAVSEPGASHKSVNSCPSEASEEYDSENDSERPIN